MVQSHGVAPCYAPLITVYRCHADHTPAVTMLHLTLLLLAAPSLASPFLPGPITDILFSETKGCDCPCRTLLVSVPQF